MKNTTHPNLITIGKGKPYICIIGCLHGDEIIGKKAIDVFKRLNLKRGTITFIIAHSAAMKKNKRFLDRDLNRVFPGKKIGNSNSPRQKN